MLLREKYKITNKKLKLNNIFFLSKKINIEMGKDRIIFIPKGGRHIDLIYGYTFDTVKERYDYDEIIELQSDDMGLEKHPEFPKKLKYSICYNNKLVTLPTLPIGLLKLYCSCNRLRSLPKLPETLKVLNCAKNKLKTLPKLPKSLKRLECDNNYLVALPELPKSLKHLDCSFNDLTELPELPKGLELLDCNVNYLVVLPELSNNLTVLHCSNNKLKSLPELPRRLKELFCGNNNLKSLPDSFINCKNLISLLLHNLELELTIQQINYLAVIERNKYLSNYQNLIFNKTIYDNNQSVHDSGIQKCIYDNIQILMRDE